MTSITYTLPGRPVTWQRTNEYRGRRLTDAGQRAAKHAHALAAVASMGAGGRAKWDLDGAFEIVVTGYYPDARVGDSDRLVGCAMDALQCTPSCRRGCNGIAWHSDRQVRTQTGRVVCDGTEARVVVAITRLAVDPVAPQRAPKRRKS